MTEEQKRIAAEAVARIVTESCDSHDRLDDEALIALAVSAAKAMVSGFAALNAEASIPLSPIYFTDDYPRPGCSLSVDVLADGYVMRCWGPKGKCLEVYPVKTACQLGRMVEEWCDGKAPQLHCAPDQTSSGSSVTE